MICDSRILIERLRENKTLTAKDVMQAEMHRHIGCPNFNSFLRTLTKYQIDEDRKQKELSQATIQEIDRRSAAKKKRKWIRGLF